MLNFGLPTVKLDRVSMINIVEILTMSKKKKWEVYSTMYIGGGGVETDLSLINIIQLFKFSSKKQKIILGAKQRIQPTL